MNETQPARTSPFVNMDNIFAQAAEANDILTQVKQLYDAYHVPTDRCSADLATVKEFVNKGVKQFDKGAITPNEITKQLNSYLAAAEEISKTIVVVGQIKERLQEFQGYSYDYSEHLTGLSTSTVNKGGLPNADRSKLLSLSALFQRSTVIVTALADRFLEDHNWLVYRRDHDFIPDLGKLCAKVLGVTHIWSGAYYVKLYRESIHQNEQPNALEASSNQINFPEKYLQQTSCDQYSIQDDLSDELGNNITKIKNILNTRADAEDSKETNPTSSTSSSSSSARSVTLPSPSASATPSTSTTTASATSAPSRVPQPRPASAAPVNNNNQPPAKKKQGETAV